MVTNLELQKSNIFKSFLILNLTDCKLILKNLDLFVQKSKFIISSDKLCSKDISFVNSVLVCFLQSFILIISFFDDIVQFSDGIIELLGIFFFLFFLLGDFIKFTNFDIYLFLKFSFVKTNLCYCLILAFNIFLELMNLKGSLFEVSSELRYLIISFDQVLRI